jgi:hypothetical protein
MATELKRAEEAGEVPLLLVGTARLGGAKDEPALFIQLQSVRECGSAGCNTAIYLHRQRAWHRILDSVSGPIMVDTARHRGMRDLIVNDHDRWVWNGSAYANTRPAPAVNLAPRKGRGARIR